MTVRYIRVKPQVNLFAPAVRAFGDVAIVGRFTLPATNPPPDPLVAGVPVAFTDPSEARRRAPGELGEAIALAFGQTPGPTLVYGVAVNSATPDFAAALRAVAALNVQLVMLANTPVTAAATTAGGPLALLVDHVVSVSTTGGDGQERMGVAMLTKGSTTVADVPKALANERMVYVAHQSDQDVAAAVTGAIAGYEPHVSLLLKPVRVNNAPFTAAQIDLINGSENLDAGGPGGQGINWLTSPSLIPGQGVFLGEGYTGDPAGKKFIDIVRTVDDVSFRLKAQLIKSIGNLRISRSGLRALVAQMEAVLGPLVSAEVLDGFELIVPLLVLLDKDPATLTADELNRIHTANVQRLVQVLAAVRYAGAMHRISITLKFE
ncbi:hypothetical protein Amsp01_030820 [Amycolatopsis sp. NBRC 101858]|uniref:hypothetical protein n=1 Tax=Amycolatopsis sp. NBRC 101858 TaxID=3032200 RepID=UPI0024A4ED12|nr:hypothetical protein [Amycolatopsis sp. NBRC 101858]GLY37058.1 hypothetical protein Amsp01_030820 [Amycolatopsis sp. NBRC 101858]